MQFYQFSIPITVREAIDRISNYALIQGRDTQEVNSYLERIDYDEEAREYICDLVEGLEIVTN